MHFQKSLFRLCGVFIAARGFLQLQRAGAPLCCAGSSWRWLLWLRDAGFRRTGFRSCGTRVQWLELASSAVVGHRLSCSAACGTPWTREGPRVPALAGGFLTPEPPGRSSPACLIMKCKPPRSQRSEDSVYFLFPSGLRWVTGSPTRPSPPSSSLTRPVLPAGPCSSCHHLYADVGDSGSCLIPELTGPLS